ncbi:hypothetical protein HYV44_03100 [Candidatus Microgenomates bacterium]|nr:hypothetical protein [Candidatus Microgenomates bacterium]
MFILRYSHGISRRTERHESSDYAMPQEGLWLSEDMLCGRDTSGDALILREKERSRVLSKILNTFVKASGDLLENEKLLAFLATVEKQCHHLVVCVGGGSQISQALAEKGIESQFGPLGREITTDEGGAIASRILNDNARAFRARLSQKGISAVVLTPILQIGGLICLVNGDIYTLSAYHGFSQLFVATRADRLEKKREEFARFGTCLAPQGKIEILGL